MRGTFKIAILLIVFVLPSAILHAQQDALFSQYMFNPFVVNPAYAGSRSSISTVIMAREQWVGFEGSPGIGTFSVHAPIIGKMAVGFNSTYEEIGATKMTGVFGTYAYHLPIHKATLSLALRAGGYFYSIDRSEVTYKNKLDPFATTEELSSFTPNFDFGAYYYTKKYYVGFAATHLTKSKIQYSAVDTANSFLSRHILISSGYAFKLTRDLILKPSVFVKYVQGAPLNVDVNASVLIRKLVWLGITYRPGNAVIFLVEANITDGIRIGYSFDILINQLSSYNSDTHEIFLGVDFFVKKKKGQDQQSIRLKFL
ncbi:MAG: type IX secretion system membrane protein PorP/SprF [Flavobacteriales bacterium]|nr:type IX secretion system membrane protein PorP/SprF [Flavobacteriales bacterium]